MALAKKDNLYRDAMETARSSSDSEIVNGLLSYFVDGGASARHFAYKALNDTE